MLKVVTAKEMQELDRRATAEFGIPSLLLMENAGAETAREMQAAFPALSGERAVILCGRGTTAETDSWWRGTSCAAEHPWRRSSWPAGRS